jgi:hypothetical protein
MIDYHLGKGVGGGVQYGVTEYYRKNLLCVLFCRTRFFWLTKEKYFFQITVTVQDINDCAPQFTNEDTTFWISEVRIFLTTRLT